VIAKTSGLALDKLLFAPIMIAPSYDYNAVRDKERAGGEEGRKRLVSQ
jgi:hypothetical protein